MTRRLEGQQFVTSYNNGVSVIAHGMIWEHMRRCDRIVQRLTNGGFSPQLAVALDDGGELVLHGGPRIRPSGNIAVVSVAA